MQYNVKVRFIGASDDETNEEQIVIISNKDEFKDPAKDWFPAGLDVYEDKIYTADFPDMFPFNTILSRKD